MAIALLIDTLLPRLLAASIQGTLLVTLVWALCRALPRLSANARCWLWWLVALQLVVGLVWSNPLALPLLPAFEQLAMPVPPVEPMQAGAAGLAAFASGDPVQFAPEASTPWSWPLLVASIWLLGLVAMIARSLTGLRASRRLIRAAEPCGDRALLQALALAADAHGLRDAPDVRVSVAITSPQLIGPWRPVLLLPRGYGEALRPDELDMTLTHELVHLQRRDLWLGLLPALAQHLFWFHPLAHLAAREYGLAREGACDAAVLAGHEHGAREYAQLLLRLGIAPRPDAGLASASPDYTFLKRRLTMLKTTRPLSSAIALSTTLLVAAVGVLPYRITNAATPPPPPPPAAAAPAPPAPPMPRAPALPPLPATPPAPSAPAPIDLPPTPALPAEPTAPPAPPAGVVNSSRGHVHTIRTRHDGDGEGALRGTFTLGKPGAESYVLIDPEHSVAVGSTDELAEARAAQRGNESLLWLRRGDARYVVRDADTIGRFREAFADVARLGERQGALGAEQGALGAEQGELGARQGEIGGRVADLALQAVRNGDDASRRTALAALEAESRALGAKLGTMSGQQVALAEQQSALARQQADAQARANRQARSLLDEAVSSGRAQRL
ncbi:M56 family metallopeptidase [Luteimonas sp. 100069]|uniref:M56 family metallopeptidase n=1 Tax=Luteimonas sp. 100069 TaxID=2006109 RepID=UPI000F4EF155|nr:M56 family metallopeptidase [Luteimonas sp. 100069]RPD88081.1 hypothetical protein EGK76_02560 [Luteimonas sp. 100069]